MAIPARLGTAGSLKHTHQSVAGSSFIGRDLSNVSGASGRSCNALPTSTSLPQLGPESPLRLRTSGEVVVDAAQVTAPIRSIALRKTDYHARTVDGQTGREKNTCNGTHNGASLSTTIAAAVALPQPDIIVAQEQDSWACSYKVASQRPTGPVADPRLAPLQLQPPPRLAGRSVQPPSDATQSAAAPERHPGLNAPGLPGLLEWSVRSSDQLHLPPSPPSASAAAPTAATRSGRFVGVHSHRRGHGRAPGARAATTIDNRQHDALLNRVLGATNWYELRAVLVTSGGGGGVDAVVFSASPDGALAVLRRLAAITAYDMRLPESADLGAFLERWLLQHTDVLGLMGPAQLSLCLHSLAKLSRALPMPPPSWTVAWFAAAQPYLLQYNFRPKDLSLSLWALSRLQLQLPPAALQLLLAAAEPHLERFNGQDLSLIALALSVLQARNSSGGSPMSAATSLLPSPAWQKRFLTRLVVVLPECGSQSLTNLLHGIVRAGMDVPNWVLGNLCTALYSKLPECNPQGLANVLSALAAVGYVPEEGWVERFLAESMVRMGGAGGSNWAVNGISSSGGSGSTSSGTSPPCNLDDLTHMAAAAAQLALAPPHWWVGRLHMSMEQLLPRASPRQLAQALHAVAQLYRATAVAAAAQAVAEPSQQPVTVPAVVGDAGGLAAVRPPRSLLTSWYHAAEAVLSGFNAIDAAHSLWALAALDERPPSGWLQRLLVTCRGGLAAAPPGDLVVLAWSLAALGFRPTWAYVADLVEASEPALGAMTGQDYAMLTSALARLGCRPQPSWSTALLGVLQGKLVQLEDRSLSQTAWALYRLRVQPPPEWLQALATELQRRWQGRGLEGCAGVGAEIRHGVMMLWIVSMWIGAQRPSKARRRRRRQYIVGLQRKTLSHRRGGPATCDAGGGGTEQPSGRLPSVAPSTDKACDALATVSPDSAMDIELPGRLGRDPEVAMKVAAAVLAVPSRRGWCRVTARMVRRRRAAKPGNLVAALGSDVRSAARFRQDIADQLLGPAMDTTAAALAAGQVTPQDVALLLAVAQRLPCASCRAAATRPAWRRAVLAAAVSQLRDLPPNGLLQTLRGLAALRVKLEPDAAAKCAAAAVPHLLAHQHPASYKVSLLLRLCRLKVHSARVPRLKAAAAIPEGFPWGSVLVAGLRLLRNWSEAAEPLLRLNVELLKARVRLRKLGLLASPCAGRTLASTVLRRLTAAQAAGLAAVAAAGCNAAEPLAVATVEVRAAVATAAAAAPTATVDADMDDENDDVAGRWFSDAGSRRQGKQRSCRVPPIGEEQRVWIWRRAHRTVAARVADRSPVLVMQLTVVAAAHVDVLMAIGPPLEAACTSAIKHPVTATGPSSDPQCGRKSLLWLAAATCRLWRVMLPVHRARVARAWRRILKSLRTGSTNRGRDGNDVSDLESQLRTQLPGSVVTATNHHRRHVPRKNILRGGEERTARGIAATESTAATAATAASCSCSSSGSRGNDGAKRLAVSS